jgi:hypothetical protein
LIKACAWLRLLAALVTSSSTLVAISSMNLQEKVRKAHISLAGLISWDRESAERPESRYEKRYNLDRRRDLSH